MSHDASWHSDIESPMRDGVVLRGDAWQRREPAPVVVFRTPYGRRKVSSDVLKAVDCLEGGFAAFVQDTRGRFGSDGGWEPIMWAQEAQDTYDTVEWVASQPWCDGQVILAGTSYGGILSFLGAATRPPHLTGVAAAMITTGRRDVAEMRGAIRLDHLFGWMIFMAADWLGRHPEHADADNIALLSSMLADPLASTQALPLSSSPLADLHDFPLDVEALLSGSLGSLPEWDAADLAVPLFVTTGWYDVFATATIDAYREGIEANPDLPHRLVVGPWSHTGPLQHIQGELNYGVMASASAIALPQKQLEFFRSCADQGASVPLRHVDYFLMGADRWATAEHWPPAEAAPTVLHLHASAGVGHAGGLRRVPASAGEDEYVYDPQDPVPSRGGRLLHLGRLTPGPIDLAWQALRPDVLHYATEPLASELDVVGAVSAKLRVALDQPDTDLLVRLVDCRPDGRILPVAEGMVRMRFRDGAENPAPVPPGEISDVTVDLGYTAQRFAAGHRLGLMVTSSNFPHVDRNLNTGESSATSSSTNPVAVRLQATGSTLTIDTIPHEGDI